jgi:hypothetical protein
MAETVLLRGEGGCVIEHSLPLSAVIQKRVDKGEIEILAPDDPEPAKATRKTKPSTTD